MVDFLMGSLCSGNSKIFPKLDEDGNFLQLSYT